MNINDEWFVGFDYANLIESPASLRPISRMTDVGF
jgi:hypothetical protein